VASIALLVALGGTGIAAVAVTAPVNSVNTAALRNSAVTNPKLHNDAVTTAKGQERLAEEGRLRGRADSGRPAGAARRERIPWSEER
jgi:hypothetical protein